MSSEHHRVIIIGAGFAGLAAAKTYLSIDPSVDILVVDNQEGPGGVWSKKRIYPSLEYEAPTPMANFSDFDMMKEFGMGLWEDITGQRLNEYLSRYADKFDIRKRCRFNIQVTKVNRSCRLWQVLYHMTDTEDASSSMLTCDKLVIATSMNSNPQTPDLDLERYRGFSFHSVQLGQLHERLTAPGKVEHITVVGGHKTAIETVGIAARAGKRVEWLIREEGGGPTWMLKARQADGSSAVKAILLRCFKVLNTSVYWSNNVVDRFLHDGRWALGTWLRNKFWKLVTEKTQSAVPQTKFGSKLLATSPSFFWVNLGGTVLHDQDMEVLRMVDEGRLVHVNRAHIVSAQGNSITLNTSESLDTDGIVFCTGWKPSMPPLFDAEQANDLGLPLDPRRISGDEKQYWENLEQREVTKLLERYPQLKNPPKEIHVPQFPYSQFRLYHQIVSPKLAARGDNSIFFLSNHANGFTPRTSEIYSLWGVAYLEGLLPPVTEVTLRDKSAMDKDIALNEAYRKTRYLNALPYRLSIAEMPEYYRRILMDLGVRDDRKAMTMPTGWRGWFGLKAWKAEWFEPTFTSEYAGIIQEFLAAVEERRSNKVAHEQTPLLS